MKKADSLKVVPKADIAENDPMTIDLSVPTVTDLLSEVVTGVETDLSEAAAIEVEIVLLIAAAETEAAAIDLHTEVTVAEIAHLTEAVVEIDRAAVTVLHSEVAEADPVVVADSVVAAVAVLAEAEDFAVVVAVAQVAAVATAAEIVPPEDHETKSSIPVRIKTTI